MGDLSYFAEVAALDTGLSIVTTLRADGTMQASLVNAGVLNHPVTGAAVVGFAELIGPLDPHPEVDAEGLRMLLRDIFIAAGGTHDDWDRYDRVMREEGRTAVLVAAARAYPKAPHPDAE